MRTFASLISNAFAIGPSTLPRNPITGAITSATLSVRLIANVLGVTSAKMNSSRVIDDRRHDLAGALVMPHREGCRHVEPPIVNSRVRNRTTFRYGAGFSTMRASGIEPRRPSSRSRTARTRFVRVIATSEAAKNPTSAIESTTHEDREPIGRRHGARTPLYRSCRAHISAFSASSSWS